MGAIATGRPCSFTQEVADAFCAGISEGKSVRTICTDDAMPEAATIFRWLAKMPSFCEQYAHAREARATARFESAEHVLEELRAGLIDPNAARVIIDTIKWQCGKESPAKYGDKLTLDGQVNLTVSIAETLRQRIARANQVEAIDVTPVAPVAQLPPADDVDPSASD